MMDFQSILNNQYKILRQLNRIPQLIKERKQREILENKNIMICLMYTLYENAKRREAQEKYDMATLLLYRLLEMIEQRRLMTYRIYVSQPKYQQADFSRASDEFKNLGIEDQIRLLKFKSFCELEEIDFDLYEKTCCFLNPITSKYYKVMGEK